MIPHLPAETAGDPAPALLERMRSAERAAVDLFRLQRVTSDLARTLGATEVARTVLDEGQRALGAASGALAVAAGGAVSVVAAVGDDGSWSGDGSPLRQVASGGVPVWAESSLELAAALGPDRLGGARAAALLPLVVDGAPTGALGFAFAEPRELDAADRDFLVALAGQAAQAFERARLYDAARAALVTSEQERAQVEVTASRLARLQNVATRLSSARSVDEVADVVLSQSIADPGASTGSLLLLDDDGVTVRLIRSVGLTGGVRERFETFPLDADLPASHVLRGGDPVFVPSLADRDRHWPALAGLPTESAAFAVVPLLVEERRIGVIALGFPTERVFDEPKRRFLAALADQCALALERARLDEAERRAAQQLEFLARAGSELAATLDLDATLARVSDLAAGTLGDLAVLYLRDETRGVRHGSARHADAQRQVLLESLRDNVLRAGTAVARALEEGRTQVLDEVTDADLRAATDEAHYEAARALRLGPAIVVPLRGRHRAVLGALALARSAGAPPYAAPDIGLAEEFAARAAVAIENSRLFALRSEVAHTLQRSLLPPRLPAVDGVAISARYRPTYEGLLVGGDFYDLFPLRDRWAFVVGDVVGTGARAATTTALVRHTARAVAPLLSGPEEVVTAIHSALVQTEGDEAFCTLVYGELAPVPGGVNLSLVGAGHPPPYLLRADGSVEEVKLSGTLLGAFDDVHCERRELLLAPGELLVCYTDGVVEARGRAAVGDVAPFFGEDGLREVLRQAPRTADGVAAAIDRAVVEFTAGNPADDVAVLVIQAV